MATNTPVEHRTVLVVGATGKQGSAFIRSLIFSPEAEKSSSVQWKVLALTRSTTSPAAQSLLQEADHHSAKDCIKLVEGDLDKPDTIRKIFQDEGKIWGVLTVLQYPGLGAPPSDTEKNQGKTVADLSFEFGVSLFMYSSAITVGANVDDFKDHSRAQKRKLELYIEKDLGPKGLPWIIIRPGFFYENFEGTFGAIAVTLYRYGLKEETTINPVGSDDIGHLVAAIFNNHQPYIYKFFNVTSGPVTMQEIMHAHQRATGKPMPAVPAVVAWLIRRMNKGVQNLMNEAEINYDARINGLLPTFDQEMNLTNSVYRIRNYEEWKRAKVEEEKLEAKDGALGWNQLSLFKLFTGQS
ncbi:hypothetical protein QBC38DRAFT_485910 [Podospora fimiseda]|uniref:NmrA-like domain-containing protein n=1 Tax=Podospora fimiseda TaxID=252190 RepID=A0AAN7GWZ1_9PEZI|nr:hypothetical protein QBC38DRAFT_485910 [Podospora fimiseda]